MPNLASNDLNIVIAFIPKVFGCMYGVHLRLHWTTAIYSTKFLDVVDLNINLSYFEEK